MLKLNCLINDTRAVQIIKDAIQIVVGERIDNGRAISFPAIYNDLRKKGLEVDAESAGKLYNEVYGHYNDPALSTEDDILSYVGKDVAEVQQSIVDALLDGTPATEQAQIGKLSPEKQVATNIARMFKDKVFGTTKKVNSVMKQMEVLVNRAAKNLLPPGQQKASATLYDNLNTFFSTEAVEFQKLDGSTNTLRTLHNAVKDEVESYLNDATDQLEDDEANALRKQWEEYTDAFIQSTYDIMLGRADQNKLLNEALKQVDIPGFKFVDVNDNIKWSALIEYSQRPGSSDAVARAVAQLFEKGIKDEQGNVQKYPREQAERVGNYFQRLYDKKMAEVVQKKIGNVRAKNISAKNIISDFIKDRGFINLVKDKDGNLLLTQANWDDALKHMKLRAGDIKGVDHAVEKLKEFLKTKTNKQGKPFTDKQIALIEDHFRDAIDAKLAPATATPTALEKLIALKNLNNGRAFESETQTALNNVLGVSNLDQSTINAVKDLVEVSQSILSGNNVNNSSSPDPAVNRGAYAFQALSQVQRRIKEIMHSYKISADKTQAQRVVKYLGDLMNAASTSLLINPGNVGENIVTGFASNIGESMLMLFTSPHLFFKQWGKSQADFWTAFISHISGGVANEVIAEEDITSDIQTGERLRLSALWKEFKDASPRSFASLMFKFPAYAASVTARTILNSFDAGFNAALLRKKAALSMYQALRSQGYDTKQVFDIMDNAFVIDKNTDKELDDANADIKKKLNSVGVYPTAADMAQNKNDMRLSLYEDAMRQAALPKKTSARQVGEATKAIVDSAQNQAKVLGGKRHLPINEFDKINQIIYAFAGGWLKPQQLGYRQQQKLEKEGRLGSAAAAQLGAEAWKNSFARFVGGIANFLALGLTATPLGFLTANSLRVQKNRIKRDATGNVTDVLTADPGDIRRYAEAHQLMRSVVMRSALGTLAIGGFIFAKMTGDDDDDDEGFISTLMATKSGRRLMTKYLPMGVNAAAAMLYDVKDKKLDSKMERLWEVTANVTGTAYNKWDAVKDALGRAKTNKELWKVFGSTLGGYTPTYNINQAEQVTKFLNVIKSAYDEKYISDVKRDEAISKAIYKQQEDFVDALMTNGMIEAMGRALGVEDKAFNRFDNDKK